MTPTKTTPGNPQTVAGGSVIKNHSRFNLSYPTLATLRFGEYTPHFYAETVPADKDILLRSSYALRSYTLKSPLLNNVKLHRDYFNVPLQAIIPRNYEKFKVNPVQGDDCPDDCGTSVQNFNQLVHDSVNSFVTLFNGSPNEVTFLHILSLLSWFYSNGSLLSASEVRLGNRVRFSCVGDNFNTSSSVNGVTADEFVDQFFAQFVAYCSSNNIDSFNVTIDGTIYHVILDFRPDDSLSTNISLREMFMRVLQQPNTVGTSSVLLTFLSNAAITIHRLESPTDFFPVDLRRLHAYNIVCAHFYSNDHIDYIYNAQLYRQNLEAIWTQHVDSNIPAFTANGVRYLYDILSGHMVARMFGQLISSQDLWGLAFFANIFNFNRSLRFMDYFTGARSNPLAIGNTNVPVSGTNVSVIDITKGVQRQRFLNAVNRSGQRFEAYIKNLFGVKPEYDYHNPFYLGSVVDDIHTAETDNTGSAQFQVQSGLDFDTQQNSVTSKFQGASSKFAFNFDSDRDSVLVGITYFDIPRFYPFGVSRIQLHQNRFDDFIPQAQFIGDQDIKLVEFGSLNSPNNSFGYTGRYQEYKMRVPYCFGGIFHYLRTWSYLALAGNNELPISPDFIRSVQTELDKFYLSLTNYSLAGYFHFIVLTNNECTSSRPMVKHPHIL